jgi:glutamate/tyrosine decarboxylase-like PLP-dependent enzyme
MTTKTPEREALQRAFVRAAAFREGLAARPPRPETTPSEMRAAFGGPTPERGEDWAAVIDALADAAEPGLMGMAGPRFFGFVIGASHPVGVAADWLTSAWGQNTGLYESTPAAAIAEETAARWLLDMLDLPAACSVGFVTGATMANFTCLVAARDEVLRRVGWETPERGLQGAPVVRVLIGEDAHTTVFKALQYVGLGESNLARIAVDGEGRMQAEAVERELARGRGPAIVVAQAGQIITGAFDPFTRLGCDLPRGGRLAARGRRVRPLGARLRRSRASGRRRGGGRFLEHRRPQVAAGALRLRARHHARR